MHENPTNPDSTGDSSGTVSTDFLSELQWRDLVANCSDVDGLRAHLAGGTRRAYVGLDPTSDSLTVGNLCALSLLGFFQRAGHEPVVLAGGGTGLIGDPGGKSAERPLLPIEKIRENITSQLRIYERLLPGAIVVNNADWLVELSYVHVLRDVGKHFSVNEMVKRDSVRNRLEGDGISYTEFSYMLLQAYDYAHLFRTSGVTLQMGGSDQWGNIVSGVDLIRRTETAPNNQAYALTTPLLLKSDGTKFGKTESGAIWLTAERTSPYAFHQFWVTAEDNDIAQYFKRFSFRTEQEIREILAEGAADPGKRSAQRLLADEITDRLHGPEATSRAKAAAQALFTGDVKGLDAQTLGELFADVPSVTLPRSTLGGREMVSLLTESGIVKSNREAREGLGNGSIYLNGERIGADKTLTDDDVLNETLTLIRKGKRNWTAIRWS